MQMRDVSTCYDSLGNAVTTISLPSQPVVGPTCDLLQVQMTENQADDELAAVNDDVAF